jgi:hypothetical protein
VTDASFAPERPSRVPAATFKRPDTAFTGTSSTGCAGATLLGLALLCLASGDWPPVEALGAWTIPLSLALFAVAYGFLRLARARFRRVELLAAPDRIQAWGDRGVVTFVLDEVAAFAEEPSGEVRLLRERRVDEVVVPPGDPAARAELLAALERSGVPRHPATRAARAQPPPPLLDVRGRGPWPERILLALTLAFHAWLPFAGSPELLRFARDVVDEPLLLLVTFTPWFALVVVLHFRRGRVTFHEDRIVARRHAFAWDDVVGRLMEHGTHITLVLRGGAARLLSPAVPTPTRAVREAVTALLVARGVPRVRMVTRAPMPGQRPAPTPLLELEGWRPRSQADLPGAVAGCAPFVVLLLALGGHGLMRQADLPTLAGPRCRWRSWSRSSSPSSPAAGCAAAWATPTSTPTASCAGTGPA